MGFLISTWDPQVAFGESRNSIKLYTKLYVSGFLSDDQVVVHILNRIFLESMISKRPITNFIDSVYLGLPYTQILKLLYLNIKPLFPWGSLLN